MGMDLYEAIDVMPFVCILILVGITIFGEYAQRHGISIGRSQKGGGCPGGYMYSAMDQYGDTYQFRINGNRRTCFKAYLESAPVIRNTSGLRTDETGKQYLSAGACTKQQAEEEVEQFVMRQ